MPNTAPLMGAEDFSFMLNARPGAYIFLGNGDTAMVHHPAYNFDDNAIPFGSSWYAGHGRRADARRLKSATRRAHGRGGCLP